MAQPTTTTKLGTEDVHTKLHNRYVNVRAFGAKGDGSTDDTAAIQAAIDLAGSNDGIGQVVIPSGNYIISSPIYLNTAQSVRITGTMGTDVDPSPGVWHKSGVRIYGSFNGPMISRTDTAAAHATRIEDIGIQNNHAAGKGIELAGIQAPAGVYGCNVRAFIGIDMIAGIFNAQIANTTIVHGNGADVGSRGVTGLGLPHTQMYSVDINGFERGIWGQQGGSIIGGRIEANGVGIYLGGGGYTGGGFITGCTFEANDTGIFVKSGAGIIAAAGINGHSGAPSGSSDYGIDIEECFGLTIINAAEAGTHTNNFIRAFGNPGALNQLTLIGCRGTTASNLTDLVNTEVINCTGPGLGNVIKAPVIATGSLPAAAAQQNGRLVIEDNGAGDRNLILYAGGQRFRVDGGAAI